MPWIPTFQTSRRNNYFYIGLKWACTWIWITGSRKVMTMKSVFPFPICTWNSHFRERFTPDPLKSNTFAPMNSDSSIYFVPFGIVTIKHEHTYRYPREKHFSFLSNLKMIEQYSNELCTIQYTFSQTIVYEIAMMNRVDVNEA